MKLVQGNTEKNMLCVPRHRQLLLALFVSHFFCTGLFLSATHALSAGFTLSPGMIGLKLMAGVLLCIGAYIPDNMLARSAWMSVTPGLIICMFASLCLLLWHGEDTSFVTFSVYLAGLGFASVNLGAANEKITLRSEELPYGFGRMMLRSKLLGAAGGIVQAVLFTMAQRGGFRIGYLRFEIGCLFALLAVGLAVSITSRNGTAVAQSVK